MSLPRKDIRAKLDPDMHEALVAVCERERCEIAEFVEFVLVEVLKRELHASSLLSPIADRLKKAGIALHDAPIAKVVAFKGDV